MSRRARSPSAAGEEAGPSRVERDPGLAKRGVDSAVDDTQAWPYLESVMAEARKRLEAGLDAYESPRVAADAYTVRGGGVSARRVSVRSVALRLRATARAQARRDHPPLPRRLPPAQVVYSLTTRSSQTLNYAQKLYRLYNTSLAKVCADIKAGGLPSGPIVARAAYDKLAGAWAKVFCYLERFFVRVGCGRVGACAAARDPPPHPRPPPSAAEPRRLAVARSLRQHCVDGCEAA